jgi:hypothetical protein
VAILEGKGSILRQVVCSGWDGWSILRWGGQSVLAWAYRARREVSPRALTSRKGVGFTFVFRPRAFAKHRALRVDECVARSLHLSQVSPTLPSALR